MTYLIGFVVGLLVAIYVPQFYRLGRSAGWHEQRLLSSLRPSGRISPMINAWWLLLALFVGMLLGSHLALDGYFGRPDTGDQDE
jgi:hypothetical protein